MNPVNPVSPQSPLSPLSPLSPVVAFEVPAVDIGAYVTGGTPARRRQVAEQVDRACREVGFMQILGHGVAPEVADGLAAAMDDLFALELDVKRQWVRPPSENRGYTAPRSEALALSAGVQTQERMKDFFEAYNVGASVSDHPGAQLMTEHYAENTWPDVASFRERVDAWRAEAARVARTMCRIFEDALGLEAGFLESIAQHPIEVLRMNNYALPQGTRVAVGDDLVGMGEHTDFGIVTILWADRVQGLQVLGSDATWYDVTPAECALLINLGDLTTRLTNEQWLSTLHRVKPPIRVVDGIGTVERRRSAAYFFDGDAEAVVGPLPGFGTPLYAPVTVDEHTRAKLAGSRAGVLNQRAERERERVVSAAFEAVSHRSVRATTR